ncbi:DNA topoisomerase 2 [Cardamine amara subsp. amara]|uniref:DNA topoisomerase 2 n=1 Tax=Cardamine amara subsp. amara TaxID=228776 RepID=A0ABD1AJD8_CARAN
MSPKLHHRQQGRRSRSKSWKPSYAVPMHTSDQLRSLPELYGYTKTKRWLSVLWIFDEILVNAAYNPSMDSVKVVIDELNNRISVCYSGDVEIHQEDGVSSNYDDDSSSDTYGGATLTNIFSTEFIMETADCKRMEKSIQVFGNNMRNKSDPVITKCDVSENWTMFTFQPDFKKFNMTELENDVVALMSKRVLDIAACVGKSVKVELNGELIQVNSFSDYVDLYLSAAKSRNVERVNERWEICVSLSDDGQFQQVSFVNSLATLEGGTHVEYVTDQITTYVADYVNKKFGDTIMKPETVKSQISIFLQTVIDNATFDSQSKEALTLEQSCFGSECQLSQVFLKKVAKSCILEGLLRRVIEIDGLNTSELGVDKLEDAFNAGGVNGSKCTLILTEGDSEKCLIMRGFSVLGQDYYGVYPLQGKLKNVSKSRFQKVR